MRASQPDPFSISRADPGSANPTSPARSEALLRLVACGGPCEPRRRLVEQVPPARALDAGAPLWRACGLNTAQVTALRGPAPATLERARAWLAEPGHHLLGWDDPDYPPLLRNIPSPPLVLFIDGDPSLLWRPAIALVGSRSPTPGGRDNAAEFGRRFAAAGLAVASGMAAGIDTAAHHAVLAVGGVTLAVLGTGADVAYPRSNVALRARIATDGAVISEHLPGTGPRKEHFPSRNRILAGLSLGTLVIEAAHRSGALITARLAGEYGREVMALPGSIHNPLARGCHRLIRDGACLVERPQEVIDLVAVAAGDLADDLRQRLSAPTSGSQATTETDPILAAPAIGAEQQELWQALGHDPCDMDQLVERTGLTAAQLSSMLLPMELEGRVVTQHGRYYRSR
ncbi:DNA-processing protein DprA [Lysobacter sp. A378]